MSLIVSRYRDAFSSGTADQPTLKKSGIGLNWLTVVSLPGRSTGFKGRIGNPEEKKRRKSSDKIETEVIPSSNSNQMV